MGDTDLCPYDMGTFGSMSTPLLGRRCAGPAPRRAPCCLQMAAERLNVPVERLQVKDGVVTDRAPANAVTYAQLVEGKRIERHLANVPVKPWRFQVMGTSPRRKDGAGKGHRQGEIRRRHACFPGLLHAAILRPPAHGAKLKSVDTTAAEKVAGVRVVKDGGMIAVLHERPRHRRRGAGPGQGGVRDVRRRGPDDKTIFDHLLKTAPQPRGGAARAATWRKARSWRRSVDRGDLSQQLRGARAHGDALGDGAVRGRQGHGVGQHAGAVPGEERRGAGAGTARGQRARHLAVRGRRIRRQDRSRPGSGGGAPGEDHGQAGAGGLEPRRRSSSSTASVRRRW